MTNACDTAIIQDSRPNAGVGTGDFDAVCHVVVLAFCAAVLACSALLSYSEEGLSLAGYRWPLTCWLHETTGIKCALCGLSRSFCALAHGDLRASLHFHRLGPAVFALFCLEVPYRVGALVVRPRRMSAWMNRLHIGLVALVSVAVLANWTLYLGGLLL